MEKLFLSKAKKITPAFIKKALWQFKWYCKTYPERKNQKLKFNRKLKRYDFRSFYKNLKVEPRDLYVGPSSACNIKCRYCRYHGESGKVQMTGKNLMKYETAQAIATQAKKITTLKRLIFTGRGEPFLNPRWFDMAKLIINNSTITEMCIFSNCMLLNEETINKLVEISSMIKLELVASIDGSSPKDTEYWRKGSDYEIIKRNFIIANEILRKNHVNFYVQGASVLPAEMRGQDYNTIMQWADSSGDYLRKDFPFASIGMRACMPDAYMLGTDTITVAEPIRNLCRELFNSIYINDYGDILDCNCALEPFVIGNVLSGDMYDLWRNSSRIAEARSILSGGGELREPEQCLTCYGRPCKNTHEFVILNEGFEICQK